jgi:hypothetical protein
METDFDREIENLEAYSPNDPPADPPEVMRSLLRKQNIDRLTDTFIRWLHYQGCSSDATVMRTFEIMRRAFRAAMVEYKAKKSPEFRLRQAALSMLLAQDYPTELRIQMLQAFDEKRYEDAVKLATEHDLAIRERPHSGKKGPDDPLNVNTDVHMDIDVVVEPDSSSEPETESDALSEDDLTAVRHSFRRKS